MGESSYLSTVTALLALALCWQGRHDEAEPLAEQSRELGASDDITTQAYWRNASSQILAARGDFDGAIRLADEAIAILEASHLLLDLSATFASAAEVYRLLGQTDRSRQLLERSLEASRKKENRSAFAWIERRIAEL
jgi:ATP/maltotriose-dependent transcriptional regulator MalT